MIATISRVFRPLLTVRTWPQTIAKALTTRVGIGTAILAITGVIYLEPHVTGAFSCLGDMIQALATVCPIGCRVFQFSEEALDWGYEHDGTSAKPARRPGFGAGPPGIAGTASSSAGHPDAGRLRHALRGPQPLRDSSMGPPARCRHGAGHGFHPAQDASGGQPSYRIPSAGRGRLRDRSGPVEPGGTAGRERHCGGRQSPAGDSRPRVARGAPGGRICSRIQPGGRAKGGWGRYRGN